MTYPNLTYGIAGGWITPLEIPFMGPTMSSLSDFSRCVGGYLLGMNRLGIPLKETSGHGFWGSFPHSLLRTSKCRSQVGTPATAFWTWKKGSFSFGPGTLRWFPDLTQPKGKSDV